MLGHGQGAVVSSRADLQEVCVAGQVFVLVETTCVAMRKPWHSKMCTWGPQQVRQFGDQYDGHIAHGRDSSKSGLCLGDLLCTVVRNSC